MLLYTAPGAPYQPVSAYDVFDFDSLINFHAGFKY